MYVASGRTARIKLKTLLLKVWLEKAIRRLKFSDALILSQEIIYIFRSLTKEIVGHDFDHGEYSRLVEIVQESFGLLWHAEIVAAGEEVGYAVLLLCEAREPEVLAEAHLCYQLSILWPMVVKVS